MILKKSKELLATFSLDFISLILSSIANISIFTKLIITVCPVAFGTPIFEVENIYGNSK